MAWIVLDLDDTLVQDMGDGQEVALPGAVDAVNQLVQEGHRLTVYTSRFVPMPASEKQRVREQIEQDLLQHGFPQMEIWTGQDKPAADIFIDDRAVTFDGDWPLALTQTQMMLEEAGLVPGPQPDDGQVPPEEPPAEEGQP
jgi:hypothetical protein